MTDNSADSGSGAPGHAVRPRIKAVSPDAAEAAFPPIGRRFEAAGLTVHATDEGHGDPPVILLHGASINLRDWTFTHSGRLAARNRVIAMDRPGFGYSRRGPGDWSPARQADVLRAAAHRMGAEKPIVVGHSWGAAVAMAWALDSPDAVSGVVTVSGATMPWGLAVGVLDAWGVGRIGVDVYMATLTQKADSGGIEAFVDRVFAPQTAPPGYLDYVGATLSLREETIAANTEDLAQTHSALAEQSVRYGTLTVPVEIVHGAEDWLLTPRRHAYGLAEHLPDARVSVAPGVGHMAHHGAPELLAAAIARLTAGR